MGVGSQDVISRLALGGEEAVLSTSDYGGTAADGLTTDVEAKLLLEVGDHFFCKLNSLELYLLVFAMAW